MMLAASGANSPQLVQLIPTKPDQLYGIERLNRGYAGPTVRVRRASDNAELDCYSQADIITHCTGTNGFLKTKYDQSGQASGRDLTEATAGAQSKIFDSSTGLSKIGATPYEAYDGTDDEVENANFSALSGNPDMTVAILMKFDDAGATSAHCEAMQLGRTGTTDLSGFQIQPRPDLTKLVQHYGGSANSYTPSPSLTTLQYLVVQRASGSAANTTTVRANKGALTRTADASGTVNFDGSAGNGTYSGIARNQFTAAYVNPFLGRIALIAVWGSANLSTTDRDALEQYMERMRVN